jgi:hypothetical protein
MHDIQNIVGYRRTNRNACRHQVQSCGLATPEHFVRPCQVFLLLHPPHWKLLLQQSAKLMPLS